MTRDPIGVPGRIAVATALVSFAGLGCEIVLMRIFSFVTWYHFVYLVIGLALLGYGAAGAWMSARGRVGSGLLAGGAALAAVGAIAAVLALGNIPFDPAAFLLEPGRHGAGLVGLILVVLIPFLGIGLVVCGILTRWASAAARVYAFDLAGAAAGCALTPALLQWVGAPALVGLLACALVAAGALVSTTRAARLLTGAAGLAVTTYLASLVLVGDPVLRVPPTKPLHEIRARGIRIELTRWSALPRIDVTEAGTIPVFGFGGALSPKFHGQEWTLRGVFQDGTAHTAMLALDDERQITGMKFLGGYLQSSAFALRRGGSALVIGAGGGIDVLNALHHDFARVVGVEMNPITADLLTNRYRDFTGGIFPAGDTRADRRVALIVAEGRHFLSTTEERFDVIQLAGVDTYAATASGAFALAEAYLYTVEGAEAFLDRLRPGGILAFSRFHFVRPRETIRIASNLIEAMARRGMRDFGRRILILSGERWANCMVKPHGFTPAETAAARAWAKERGFGVLFDPDTPRDTPFDRLIRADAPARRTFLAAYPYDISPATDDRPFFFQYYKPSRLLAEGPYSRMSSLPIYFPAGLLVLAVSFVLTAALCTLMILLPLALARRRRAAPGDVAAAGPARWRVLLYFGGLGAGFLFVEIALMQRFTVLLGDPTHAVSVILFSLLAASAAGSRWSAHCPSRHMPWLVPAAVAAGAFTYGLVIPALMSAPFALRVASVVALVAPLGFLLGMPFPMGIRALSITRATAVPWAFAVNACFTVIGSTGAMITALILGYRAAFLAGALLYLIALIAFRPNRRLEPHAPDR